MPPYSIAVIKVDTIHNEWLGSLTNNEYDTSFIRKNSKKNFQKKERPENWYNFKDDNIFWNILQHIISHVQEVERGCK